MAYSITTHRYNLVLSQEFIDSTNISYTKTTVMEYVVINDIVHWFMLFFIHSTTIKSDGGLEAR